MKLTKHSQQRMSERGIKKTHLAMVLKFGRIDGDKLVLDRKTIDPEIAWLKSELSALVAVRDKGGLAVVEYGNALITAYPIRKR